MKSTSHAAYAKTRRPPATSVCSLPMRRIPRRNAPRRYRSTRCVCKVLDSRCLEELERENVTIMSAVHHTIVQLYWVW